MFFRRKIVWLMLALMGAILLIESCLNQSGNLQADVRGQAYAGAASCAGCHKHEYEACLQSAHQNSSRPASRTTVAGSFNAPENVLLYSDSVKVVMEEKNDRLWQSSYTGGHLTESHPFDIVIGSGRKAQTYLYHEGDEIHQLPISYFVPAASWAISPGFPSTYVSFKRNIPSACFGCHASAANVSTVQTGSLSLSEIYIPGQQLLGIDCERCHGPAMQHVLYQTEHPQEKAARYITSISSLSRAQKMDMCGLCHSGIRKSQQSVFDFKPGDALDNFYYPDFMDKPADKMDVHGTQLQFLKASTCYRKSQQLTCNTCHNPHEDQRTDMAGYSQKCMSCHTEANHNFCPEADTLGAAISKNCIDCHMPTQASRVITLLTNGRESPRPDYIRTHVIAVYPDVTKKMLQYFRQQQ